MEIVCFEYATDVSIADWVHWWWWWRR